MTFRRFGAAVLAALLAAPAIAGGPLQVTSHLVVARRVAQPDGTVRIDQVPATRAAPGDRVTVIVTYRNVGAAALAAVAVADPLPRALTFRAPASPDLELSVDGVRCGPLAALGVASPDGGSRPARADDVTVVRRRLATLAPGEAGQFSFDASIK